MLACNYLNWHYSLWLFVSLCTPGRQIFVNNNNNCNIIQKSAFYNGWNALRAVVLKRNIVLQDMPKRNKMTLTRICYHPCLAYCYTTFLLKQLYEIKIHVYNFLVAFVSQGFLIIILCMKVTGIDLKAVDTIGNYSKYLSSWNLFLWLRVMGRGW